MNLLYEWLSIEIFFSMYFRYACSWIKLTYSNVRFDFARQMVEYVILFTVDVEVLKSLVQCS